MQLLFIIILSEFFKIREIRANKLSQKFLSRKVSFDVNSDSIYMKLWQMLKNGVRRTWKKLLES